MKAGTNKKILVVEDDRAEMNALEDTLTREGFIVSTAENGRTGLERAFADHPDLILLDIVMPEMDGLTMLNTLRQDEWGKSVPAIILTNLNPDDEIVRRNAPTDFAYFLIKATWRLEDVVRAIRKELKME
ncbi:MAG: response regulator with CheY-like protein receiver domain and winged-helix DNA-binding-like protein [Candidatus Wolfebacteria bacterium GW2011_GWB1_47_1]|nr:MAG: response regulator with CheY-like protein receiver domain and winged-helix DNA-binding-like protein [Candidatus Wolfebacteria bacterium GW2011_GWB1_47_1]